MPVGEPFQLIWTPFLKKQKHRVLQAVGLVCPAAGGEFVLEIGTRRQIIPAGGLLRYPAESGQTVTYLWLIPQPRRAVRIRAAWKPPRGKVHRSSLSLRPANRTTIHVLFKSAEFSDKMTHRCLVPITFCPSHLEKWLEHSSLNRSSRLELPARECRLTWSLTPDRVDTDVIGLEAVCRSLYAARRLAERFGCPPPTAASMSAVPTTTLGLAITAAGGTFLQFSVDSELAPQVPPLFRWELPDSSRLLCHAYPAGGTSLLPPPHWPYSDWPAVQVLGKNADAQMDQIVERVAWIGSNFDYPACRFSRLEEFAGAIRRRSGSELPTIEHEFLKSSSKLIHRRHQALESREQLPCSEITHTLASWATPGEVYQHEAQASGLRTAYQELTESSLNGSADRAVNRAHAALVNCVTNGCGELGIALFNPVNWQRKGLARLADDQLPAGEFELVDSTTGEAVLYERGGGWIEFITPPVPACGYLVLDVKPVARRTQPGLSAEWEERTQTLHTNEYSLQFHKAGGMARWHDRGRSCQWCSNEVDFPMGTYLHRPAKGSYAGGGPATVGHEITPLYSRISIEADQAAQRSKKVEKYRTTFTLYCGMRDLHVNVELKGRAHTGAGYAFFPFAGEEPFVLVERNAHQLNPAEDLAEGSPIGPITASRGVRVEGSHGGVNFYSLHTPFLQLTQPPSPSKGKKIRRPNGVIYAKLFDENWNTGAGSGNAGARSSFDFILRSTGNDDWDGGLARSGAEIYRPITAAVVSGRRADASRSLLDLQPTTAQLVTLKPADFGQGVVMRIWNSDADSITAKLILPSAGRKCALWKCDLLERPQRTKLTVDRQGQTQLRLEANEIATLLLV